MVAWHGQRCEFYFLVKNISLHPGSAKRYSLKAEKLGFYTFFTTLCIEKGGKNIFRLRAECLFLM